MNFERPMTPAVTGPESIPIRTSSGSAVASAQRTAAGSIASARSAIASAWSGRGTGSPAAAM